MIKKKNKNKGNNKNKVKNINFKDTLKDVLKNMKVITISFCKDLKRNPKKTLLTLINNCFEILKNNPVFFTYVITSLFIGVVLRYFTIHTLDNLLLLKPVLGDLAIILLLGSVSFILKEKNRFPYLLTVNIIFTIICVVNSIYYTFYTSFVSVSLISTSRYAVQVGDAIVENVMKIQDFIYILAPILLIYVYIKSKKRRSKKYNPDSRDLRKMVVSMIGGVIVLLTFIFSLTSLEIGRYAKQWNREYIVMRFGVYAYQLNDIVKSIEPKLTSLFGFDNALKTFTEYFADRSDTQDWTNEYTGIFEGKNIIVIHDESMQNLNIGLTFNGEEVTPTLNKLVKESIYFSNFYSQVSVGTSSDSEFTFNTSLMPSNNGTVFVSYFDREYVSIPWLLRDKGYYTFSMHANNGSYWNRNIMHETLGYERFYSKSDYEIDEIIGLGLSDESFLRQSVEKIKEINAQGQPYYGTVITLSNHTPFSDVDKYGEFDVDLKETVINEETGEEEVISYPYMEGTKLGNYFKSAHYADVQLGMFIDMLEEEGLMENTVLIIYGDHDARLSKADYRRLYNYDKETDSTKECTEEDEDCVIIDTNTYELLRKVPFIIYSKETKESLHTEVTDVMGMYDCMPTLGNMFGFYNKYALGHDIFEIGEDNIVVFPNGNWVTNKIYYNSQNNTWLPLKETEIEAGYIEANNEYAEKLLGASNATIVYDLIKNARETAEAESDYIEEKVIE